MRTEVSFATAPHAQKVAWSRCRVSARCDCSLGERARRERDSARLLMRLSPPATWDSTSWQSTSDRVAEISGETALQIDSAHDGLSTYPAAPSALDMREAPQAPFT